MVLSFPQYGKFLMLLAYCAYGFVGHGSVSEKTVMVVWYR